MLRLDPPSCEAEYGARQLDLLKTVKALIRVRGLLEEKVARMDKKLFEAGRFTTDEDPFANEVEAPQLVFAIDVAADGADATCAVLTKWVGGKLEVIAFGAPEYVASVAFRVRSLFWYRFKTWYQG